MQSVFASRAAGASVLSLCALAVGGAAPAQAGMATITASAGHRSAAARFDVFGGNLRVRLTNTSALDAAGPSDVLTAVFFDIAGPALAMGRVTAVLGAGSSVLNTATQPVGGSVGGEWAYKGTLAGAPRGARHGLSAADMGLFTSSDRFNGTNLAGPASPAGLEFGITTAGDQPAAGEAGMLTPLVRNSMTFTLSGAFTGFDPMARITNVSFQYGTGTSEPNIPAPGAAGLLGLGLLARRKRR